MSEDPIVQLTQNGQELQKSDVNTIAMEAALGSDRALAEILRLSPYAGAVQKCVLPFGHEGATTPTQGPIVGPNGATGQVLISPFRAVVGSRTAAGTDAVANWRDIRTALYTGSPTSLTGTVGFGANSSGNPRWDLVYAAVAVDANGASVTRYKKDPTTKVVTSNSLVTTLVTSVTIGVTAGTPGASPALPTIPSDGGGTYYIPLAYVRIPTGFGGASTVAPTDILDAAPMVPISRTTGAVSSRPSSSNSVVGESSLATAATQSWGSSGTRPKTAVPRTMVGREVLDIFLDLLDPSSANWSHASGAVIDDSNNWTDRIFEYVAKGRATDVIGAPYFPWESGASGVTALIPQVKVTNGTAVTVAQGGGQSFYADLTAVVGAGAAGVVELIPANMSPMQAATAVYIYSDLNDSGKLKLFVTGAPQIKVWITIYALARYTNR